MTISKIQQAIQSRQEAGLSITNLSFTDFTFYDSLLTRKKVRKAFANIFRYPYYYPTAKGEPEALQALCTYYKQKGREVLPASLMITASISESYLYLLRIFSSDNGEILAPKPFSPALDEVAAFLGQEIKTFALDPTNGWQIDLADLEKQITANTRAIFLMSPHLPTGSIVQEETFQKIFNLIKGKNIALIMDQSLSDFIFNQATFPLISEASANRNLVVTLQTIGNSFALPGLKLSWMHINGPKTQAEQLLSSLELISDTFLNVNQLSQTILPEVVRYSRHWRRKLQKAVEKNRDILVGKLSKSPRLKFHYPEGGFYALIEVLPPVEQVPPAPEGIKALSFENSEDFAVSLLEKTGVYVHPGSYYGQEKGCYFMACFLQEPAILRKSLKKIIKYLRPPKKTVK